LLLFGLGIERSQQHPAPLAVADELRVGGSIKVAREHLLFLGALQRPLLVLAGFARRP
jgi:hypothetical protein